MIAIVSGRHGSGKTWLAVSLAQVLSALKQRVLLFDGAMGINNVKKQLGLDDYPDLDMVIYGSSSLNQVVTSYSKGKFDMVLSKPSSFGLATLSIGGMQIFGDDLNIIAQDYDRVILDIDVNNSDATNALIGMAKTIIMVCNDTVDSITESYRYITNFYHHYPNTKIGVVLNQVDSYEKGRRAYDTLASTCNKYLNIDLPLLGIVREDTRVRDAIRNQITVINRYPQSEASQDIISLAKEILK